MQWCPVGSLPTPPPLCAPPVLPAAWKLLGDVLAAHHAVSPSSSHPTIPAAAGAAGQAGQGEATTWVEGQAEAWRRRVAAVRQGRRAYAKALHLHPAQPGGWLDAAFAYHHEAQVGGHRCKPTVGWDGLGPEAGRLTAGLG